MVCVEQDGMGGNTELVNVVYLDNMTLELYHRLLDKHPNATTYRITCVSPARTISICVSMLTFIDPNAVETWPRSAGAPDCTACV